jgi:hypothetical protein
MYVYVLENSGDVTVFSNASKAIQALFFKADYELQAYHNETESPETAENIPLTQVNMKRLEKVLKAKGFLRFYEGNKSFLITQQHVR